MTRRPNETIFCVPIERCCEKEFVMDRPSPKATPRAGSVDKTIGAALRSSSATQGIMRISLGLLAGDVGYAKFLLERCNKALLNVGGRSLLSRSLEVAGRTSLFHALYVVGPSQILANLPPSAGRLPVRAVAQGHSLGANLKRLIERSDSDEILVVVTCDAPFVTATELEAFGQQLVASKADVLVGISRQPSDLRPDLVTAYRRSMVPMRDGAYLISNMIGVRREALTLLDRADQVFGLRKQTRLATKLRTGAFLLTAGYSAQIATTWLKLIIAKTLWSLLPNSSMPFRSAPDLSAVRACLQQSFGDRVDIASASTIGACWDVDTEAQLALIRRLLARQESMDCAATGGLGRFRQAPRPARRL